jgi:hypothetical protein
MMALSPSPSPSEGDSEPPQAAARTNKQGTSEEILRERRMQNFLFDEAKLKN